MAEQGATSTNCKQTLCLCQRVALLAEQQVITHFIPPSVCNFTQPTKVRSKLCKLVMLTLLSVDVKVGVCGACQWVSGLYARARFVKSSFGMTDQTPV